VSAGVRVWGLTSTCTGDPEAQGRSRDAHSRVTKSSVHTACVGRAHPREHRRPEGGVASADAENPGGRQRAHPPWPPPARRGASDRAEAEACWCRGRYGGWARRPRPGLSRDTDRWLRRRDARGVTQGIEPEGLGERGLVSQRLEARLRLHRSEAKVHGISLAFPPPPAPASTACSSRGTLPWRWRGARGPAGGRASAGTACRGRGGSARTSPWGRLERARPHPTPPSALQLRGFWPPKGHRIPPGVSNPRTAHTPLGCPPVDVPTDRQDYKR
jgi:hypothetical protein